MRSDPAVWVRTRGTTVASYREKEREKRERGRRGW